MCQRCLDERVKKYPDGWKCDQCGSKNMGGVLRGDTKCFECWKSAQEKEDGK